MILERTGPPAGLELWAIGILLAVAIGVAAAVSVPLGVGLVLVLAATYGFSRSPVRIEIVVALFWIAFDLYYTLFAHVSLPGFFYPFYAVFFVAFAVRLLRSQLRLMPMVIVPYALFMLVVVLSFLTFNGPIDFQVLQRLIAYLFGALILFQVGSPRGLRVVLVGAIMASTAVSLWVLVRAAQGGFGYRADVGIDQNVVAFEVGLGLVMLAAWMVHQVNRRSPPGAWLVTLLLMALHIYGFLLLASRGVSIALGLSLVALIVRGVVESRRTLIFALALAAVVGASFVLPGGQGLIQRFQGERVQTASGRIPIWEATLSSYTDSNAYSLALGHGFNSSKALVARHFVELSSTHEAYLEILYEFGVIGLGLFLLTHGVLILRGWSMKSVHGLVLYGIVWFLLGADLSLDVPDGFLYWIALGFAMALATWGGVRPLAAAGEAA